MSSSTANIANALYRQKHRAATGMDASVGWVRLASLTAGCLSLIGMCLWRLWLLSADSKTSVLSMLHASFIMVLVFACAVGEYAEHRWGLHARATRNAHKDEHHRMFVHTAMYYDTLRDLPAILFGTDGALKMLLVFAPGIALVLGCAFGAAYGWWTWATLVAYFLAYEWLHLACHSDPARSWIGRLPGVRYLSRHHQTHHDPMLMGRFQFGITTPIFDWICGTLYRPNQECTHRA
jgi:hypothetical protein